jgi:hypothetical protein
MEPAPGTSFWGALAARYRRWFVLEPTIFLFLVSGRMAYFTRTNLFMDVSNGEGRGAGLRWSAAGWTT